MTSLGIILTKRRKVDVKCRDFSDVWTEKYFFTLHFGIPTVHSAINVFYIVFVISE